MADPTDTNVDQFSLERLQDRAQITSMMSVYTRCADLNLPEQQAAVFTDDCRVLFHPGHWIEGRVLLAETLTASMSRLARSSHSVSNVEIWFDGPDTAAAQSVVIAWHRRYDGSEWTLYGRYMDRWVRAGGSWRICERELRAAGAVGRDDSELPSLGRTAR
jgi:3-phenylpropionate/cinnamic acid dioxygenase small subunit